MSHNVKIDQNTSTPIVRILSAPVRTSRNVPRTSRATGTNTVKKNAIFKAAAAVRRNIEEISEENRIKSLEMSDCIIASREGRFARLEIVKVLGHMGLGCIMIESSGHTDYDAMYDIVEIYEQKAAKDYEKAMDAYQKALKAYEDQEAAKLSEICTQSDVVKENPTIEDEIINSDDKDPDDPASLQSPFETKTLEKPEMPTPPIALAERSTVNLFAEKSANCLEPMVYNKKKNVRKAGNHISKLFDVVRLTSIGFFDFRVNGTKFIIPGTSVYRLVTPEKYPTKWYVVMGDVQMKSETIKSIDPSYQTSDVIQEHMAMLDRIKSANKTTELDENLDDEIPALVEELTS
jgi:tetratricopeptide (TPR) repeat protein